MIGGTVVKTIALPNRIWINCEEDNSTSQCAIYVQRDAKSEAVKPGDSIWWQGERAMHTPYENRKKTCNHTHHFSCSKAGVDYDIVLKRIGFSGVKKPEVSFK